MNDIFKLLIEEVALRSDVVHHTDILGLVGILGDGILMPSRYYTIATNAKSGKDGVRELSSLRRSVDRYIRNLENISAFKWEKEMTSLTRNAGGIKIYLFSNNILSSIRGVRRKPISEYGKDFYLAINHSIGREYDKHLNNQENMSKKEFDKFVKRVGKKIYLSKGKFSADDGVKEVISKLRKIDDKERFENELKDILIFISRFHKSDFYRPREGEERFIFFDKKTRGIPVNTKFMKIRVMEPFSRFDIIEAYKEETDDMDYLKEIMVIFKKNIIKYKKIFMIDKNFKQLIKAVDELIEKGYK